MFGKNSKCGCKTKSEWIKNHLETETDLPTDIIPLFSFPAEKSSFSTVQFLLLGFGGFFFGGGISIDIR